MCLKPALQAALRREKGEEWTAFSRIEDGGRAVAAGDVVRLGLRPAVVGTVLHFAVQQVCCPSCSRSHATPAADLHHAQLLRCLLFQTDEEVLQDRQHVQS